MSDQITTVAGPEEFLSAVSMDVRRPDESEIEVDESGGSRDGTVVVLAADLA